MATGNFLDQLTYMTPEGGNGILVEKPLNILADLKVTATGTPIGSGTAPTAAVTGVSFADGETALLQLVIPEDYDLDSDICKVRFYCIWSVGTTAAGDIGFTTTQNLWRSGAAVDATAAAAVTVFTLTANVATAQVGTVDISSNGYRPGDVIVRTVDANETGAEEIIVLGLSLIYRSMIVAYNPTNR